MSTPISFSSKRLLLPLLALAGLLPASSIQAQTFSVGADVVSRYIWRGTDYGEAASFQPAVTFSSGGFEIGAWGSYGVADADAANEADLWAGYGIETPAAGTFGFGVTDYYFPNAGFQYFDYDGDGEGGHLIEPYLSYSGPETFPLSLWGGYFVHNDPDKSIYLQASYPFVIDGGVELGLLAGASGGESTLYATNKFTFINLGLSVSKAIPISDQYELPVSVSYIVNPNPNVEQSYLVFGIGISL